MASGSISGPVTTTAMKVIAGQKTMNILNIDAKPSAVPRGTPPLPSILQDRDHAIYMYNHICQSMLEMGILSPVDAPMITQAALLYQNIMEAQETLDSEVSPYYSSQTQNGRIVRVHPALSYLLAADTKFREYMNAFGLTPLSRARMGLDGTFKEDPEEKYFNVA